MKTFLKNLDCGVAVKPPLACKIKAHYMSGATS